MNFVHGPALLRPRAIRMIPVRKLQPSDVVIVSFLLSFQTMRGCVWHHNKIFKGGGGLGLGDKTGIEACEETEGRSGALTHSTDVLPTTRTSHVGLFHLPPLTPPLLLKRSVEAPAGAPWSSPLLWAGSS